MLTPLFLPKNYNFFYWVFSVESEWPKSLQISRTLRSILADLKAVVCIALILPLIPNSFNLFFSSKSNWSLRTNYNWYHHHPHVWLFFQLSGKIQIFICLFACFHFYSVVYQSSKIDEMTYSFFFDMVFLPGLGDLFVSLSQIIFCYFTLYEFFIQFVLVFHWSPSDSKFLQISGILLSNPNSLNSVVIWIVSILSLISSLFS